MKNGVENIKNSLKEIENFFKSNKENVDSSHYSKELNKIINDLIRIKKEIESETYFISIVGGIKTGKSTLINLLCHQTVSTTRAGVETTKRPVIISSGKEDKIFVFEKDAINSEPINDEDRQVVIDYIKKLDDSLPDNIAISQKELETDSISEILTSGSNSSKIILVHITVNENNLNKYENCLLKNKIMFIDTPGLDGIESSIGGIENNNGHWLLKRVDLSVILQSTVSPINSTMDSYLKQLHGKDRPDYLLVHNSFSLKNWLKDVSSFEKDINENSIKKAQDILQKIEGKDYNCKIVDLAKAEDAFELPDLDLKKDKKSLLKESNFEEFEKGIYNLIENGKKDVHTQKCIRSLRTFLDDNELEFLIKNPLDEEKRRYEEKYELLKYMFNWDNEGISNLIEKHLNEPFNKDKQHFDDGFEFNKQLDISDQDSNIEYINEYRTEIKKQFLQNKYSNFVKYIFQRKIINDQDEKIVDEIIELFDLDYEYKEKGTFLRKDKINTMSFRKYFEIELETFFTEKVKSLEEFIDLKILEAKTILLKDDLKEAKKILIKKKNEYLNQLRRDLLKKTKQIFDDFLSNLSDKDKKDKALSKFIGINSEHNKTKLLSVEIKKQLEKLKKNIVY